MTARHWQVDKDRKGRENHRGGQALVADVHDLMEEMPSTSIVSKRAKSGGCCHRDSWPWPAGKGFLEGSA